MGAAAAAGRRHELRADSERVSLEPAEVYSAVTGKTGAQVEAWKRKHGGEGRDRDDRAHTTAG